MREKLDDVNRSLEESRNSLEKLKRESSMKSEKERLQIGELQLEVSRLKSQLEEKVEKYEGIKASLVEQLNREKEAKYEMVIFSFCLSVSQYCCKYEYLSNIFSKVSYESKIR